MIHFPKDLSTKEFKIFKKIYSPQKIQDFLDTLPFNFEKRGETLRSPLETLRAGTAHCMEGALLAAAFLWYHGQKPLLLDLKTTDDDFDHVVTLFKKNNLWGAISKTNHGVLRYRDPVHKSVRELVMSYFHEYFLNKNGKKTLRSYSTPFDMTQYGIQWLTSTTNLWNISRDLDISPHFNILPNSQSIKNLRPASKTEIVAGKIVEWK